MDVNKNDGQSLLSGGGVGKTFLKVPAALRAYKDLYDLFAL